MAGANDGTGEGAAQVLIEARDLRKTYRTGGLLRRGRLRPAALDGVSLRVTKGETLGLVGESGCGKSTLGRALLRLHEVDAGEVLFEGRSITAMSRPELRRLRPLMQMVFQDSYAALNPRRRIGALLAEPLRVHKGRAGAGWSEAQIAARIEELMDLVGLDAGFLPRYAHEMSGGQRQRINIARALMLSPRLVVADEPVSALDVSIQAQVLNLFVELQHRMGLTYVFVSHDLGVIRQIATRVAVMYAGTIVEIGETDAVLHRPAHPYTAALVASVLDPHQPHRPRAAVERPGRVKAGIVEADAVEPAAGTGASCRYADRCPRVQPRCLNEIPSLTGPDARQAACHFPLATGA